MGLTNGEKKLCESPCLKDSRLTLSMVSMQSIQGNLRKNSESLSIIGVAHFYTIIPRPLGLLLHNIQHGIPGNVYFCQKQMHMLYQSGDSDR